AFPGLFFGSFLFSHTSSRFFLLLFLNLPALFYFLALFPCQAPALFLLFFFQAGLFLPLLFVFYHVKQRSHMCAQLPSFSHGAVAFPPFRPAILHRYGHLMPLLVQHSRGVSVPVFL